METCLLLRIFGDLFFINAFINVLTNAQDLFNAPIKVFTTSLLYEIYHPYNELGSSRAKENSLIKVGALFFFWVCRRDLW